MGFLEPFGGRARVILMHLLAGYSRSMAATAAGISAETLRQKCKGDPELAEAVETAQSIGFSAVYEAELYDRALDRADRGSMRALELVVKSRSAAYRDKVAGQLDVVHRFDQSLTSIAGGWKT